MHKIAHKLEVETFFETLGYDSNDSVYLRGISTSGFGANKAVYKLNEIDYNNLENWEKSKHNIYAVINGGGDKDKEVKECKAIFYEHDNLEKSEQKKLWEKLGLPEPSIQVDTGGKSVHSYWVFDEPINVENWKTLQKDLLEFSDGDRSIKNPSRVMRLPGFAHQKTGNHAKIISNSRKRYSYQELRHIIPIQGIKQSIIFPAKLYRSYGNSIALWLYCRFYDVNGSGKAEIDLVKCSEELKISVSTLRKWLCWEKRLWRSWRTKNGKAVIYYVSSHNLAAKAGLNNFNGGVCKFENISDIGNHRLSIIATETEIQAIQKKSRYAAHQQAIERAAIKHNLNPNNSENRKRLEKLARKTLHSNDLVFLPAKKMARVLWKAGCQLGVSEGFLSYGASQKTVALCRGLSVRQVQRHLSNEYRCSKSPIKGFRSIYPIYGVQVHQRLNHHRGQQLNRELLRSKGLGLGSSDEDFVLGKVWKNGKGRWFERKCKIYELTLVTIRARFRRSRVKIDK